MILFVVKCMCCDWLFELGVELFFEEFIIVDVVFV